MYLLLIVSAIALVIASVYLMVSQRVRPPRLMWQIVRAFTSIIIPLTMILTVLLNIGICVCELELSVCNSVSLQSMQTTL